MIFIRGNKKYITQSLSDVNFNFERIFCTENLVLFTETNNYIKPPLNLGFTAQGQGIGEFDVFDYYIFIILVVFNKSIS